MCGKPGQGAVQVKQLEALRRFRQAMSLRNVIPSPSSRSNSHASIASYTFVSISFIPPRDRSCRNCVESPTKTAEIHQTCLHYSGVQ